MNNFLKQKNSVQKLQCPTCGHGFFDHEITSEKIVCEACDQSFPIIAGIPIMIDDTKSIFSQNDFIHTKNLFFDVTPMGKIRSMLSKLLPSLVTPRTGKLFNYVETLVCEGGAAQPRPRILVLGGSILGKGMKQFVNNPHIDFVHSDVSFGPMTEIILDAHTIPFQNETFDAVIAQAVLEHVIDPVQCVAEIWRVLKPSGIVFADTPFMQQVHGGAYDFTRFTRNGQRKLFARFTELKSGSSSGSGSVMAWSYQYMLLGLFGYTKLLRYTVKVFARITGFWMKYFDYLETYNPYRVDGASAIYFIGKKSSDYRSDRAIIEQYNYDILK